MSLLEKARAVTDTAAQRAGALSAGLADAAVERAKVALNDFNAALPVLKRAGYTPA